jgi:hypothetical protein
MFLIINLPYLTNKKNEFRLPLQPAYALSREVNMRCPSCASEYSFEEPCLCLPANYFSAVLTWAGKETSWQPTSDDSPLQKRPKLGWVMPIGEA